MLSAFDALPKPASFKLTTEPVRRVLEALGRPQDRLPPVIHIAGTNGKGSTTAFMRAIAEAHGLKVHVDTSPHLIKVNERIRLAGELISDEALRALMERVLDANAGEPLSFFEGMTCAAYLAFSETPADLTLVEVGLGGRFDSTNVFDKVAVSVITPIDYDHKDFLGFHLCQIAWEKAGIIKADAPVVTASQAREVERTLRAEAVYRGAPFFRLEDVAGYEVTSHDPADMRMTLTVDELELEDVGLGLYGVHQFSNAALAIYAWQKSGVVSLKTDKVQAGLMAVDWPARLQTLKDGPVTQMLPGKKVVVDGGHNPHAAVAIAQTMVAHAPVSVAIAMLKVKDAGEYLKNLGPVIGHLACIPMPGDRNGHDPAHLKAVAEKLGLSASAHDSLDAGLERLAYEKSDLAFLCGSLYLAGDILRRNGEEVS